VVLSETGSQISSSTDHIDLLNTAASRDATTTGCRSRPAGWSLVLAGVALGGASALYLIDRRATRSTLPDCVRPRACNVPAAADCAATASIAAWAFRRGLDLNPLAVLLVPFYALLVCHLGLGLIRGRGIQWTAPRPAVIWLGLGGIILFGDPAKTSRGFDLESHTDHAPVMPAFFSRLAASSRFRKRMRRESRFQPRSQQPIQPRITQIAQIRRVAGRI